MRRIITLVTLVLAITALAAGAVQAHPHDPDGAVENGWFYSQAGAGDGTGFSVTDADGIPFWTEFQAAGGVARLGYPVSRRWMEGPLTYQAFQKTVFQWQPRSGLFRVNIYDRLRDIGLDDELLTQRNIPKPWEFPQDDDQSFSFVQKNHLVLLELNDAIKTAWFSNPNWLNDYGLPVAYHDFGRLRVLRAQRTVFQQWMFQTAFARPGQVVLTNGGDHFKDAGLVPPAAAIPHESDDVVATVTAPPEPRTAQGTAPAMGPGPTSASIGEVLHLVASPFVFQDKTIWLGTSTGGVLRSTNAGAGFTQVISGLPNLTINAILPSPDLSNDGLVLVATNAGVARSTNRGETWSTVSGLPGGRIGGLAASSAFATDSAFFAVADAGGLFESTDGGANWSAVPIHHSNGLGPGYYRGLATVDGRGGKSHVFAWTATDLFGSSNNGRGFRSQLGLKALPGDLDISAVAVHPEFRSNEIIWIGSIQHGLYRSTNGGEKFGKVLENPKDELGRINVIALSPNISRDGTVAIGTTKMGLFFSKKGARLGNVTDPGGRSNWSHQSVNLDITNVRGIAFSNGYREDRSIFAGGETKVAFSHSGAIDWYTYPNPVGPTG